MRTWRVLWLILITQIAFLSIVGVIVFHLLHQLLGKFFGLPLVKNPKYSELYQSDLACIGKELTVQDTFIWNTTSNDFPTSSLTSFYRVLCKITLSNWFPNSHASSVTLDIGKFLYVVGNEVSIDLGTIIFDKIINAFQSKGKHLFFPFPCLIHRIAVSSNIKLTGQDVFIPVSKLDKSYKPKLSNLVPPPPQHPYPLLRDIDPSSWKFKLFEKLYVHQHKMKELQDKVDRFLKRKMNPWSWLNWLRCANFFNLQQATQLINLQLLMMVFLRGRFLITLIVY